MSVTKKFLEEVAQTINERGIFPNRHAEVQEVVKTNTTKLAITLVEVGSFSPTFYFDNFEGDVDDAIGYVKTAMSKSETPNFDPSKVRDIIASKLSEVRMAIVNSDKNSALKKEVVGREVLDLFVYYYIPLQEFSNGYATVKVSKDIAEAFDLDESELFVTASKNLDKDFEIQNPFEDLSNELGFMKELGIIPPFTVFTNSTNYLGAVQMLNYHRLQKFADEIEDDLYVIPSSIHEVIVLPTHFVQGTASDLSDMIRMVNGECLSEDEVLGVHPYKYIRGMMTLV